jgi:molecular chaperone DnaK
VVQKLLREHFNKEPDRGIDPMECVAMGAAIQAGILQGDIKNVLLLDVTPLSLGIETLGGVMTPLVKRNTTIPTRKSEIFSTAADNQPAVSVHVLQGERSMARDNKSIGRFDLVGIPPAPRGVPQIEVTFDIDANGIVNVSAKDMGTGKEQKITITSSTAMNKEDIDRMVRDAEKFAADDARQKETIEIRNQAESLIYTTEKSLREFGEKVPEADRRSIEEKMAHVKKALEGGNTEVIKKSSEELAQASHKLAEALYHQTGGANGPQAEPSRPGPSHAPPPHQGSTSGDKEDNVVEAEFTKS